MKIKLTILAFLISATLVAQIPDSMTIDSFEINIYSAQMLAEYDQEIDSLLTPIRNEQNKILVQLLGQEGVDPKNYKARSKKQIYFLKPKK